MIDITKRLLEELKAEGIMLIVIRGKSDERKIQFSSTISSDDLLFLNKAMFAYVMETQKIIDQMVYETYKGN